MSDSNHAIYAPPEAALSRSEPASDEVEPATPEVRWVNLLALGYSLFPFVWIALFFLGGPANGWFVGVALVGFGLEAALGVGLSIAAYLMQRAQGRPVYAGVCLVSGVLSLGVLLIPLLVLGPTRPKAGQ